MSQFMEKLNKTSTTSIIALLIIGGFVITNNIMLFHNPPNENAATLILGNMSNLAAFVAGYYFNKKGSNESNESDLDK